MYYLSAASETALGPYGLSKCGVERIETSKSFYVCLFVCVQNYLDNFWPDLKAAHELFDSILQARRERESESQENNGREYPEHLPVEILEAGIKSGRYIQVICNRESTHRTMQPCAWSLELPELLIR